MCNERNRFYQIPIILFVMIFCFGCKKKQTEYQQFYEDLEKSRQQKEVTTAVETGGKETQAIQADLPADFKLITVAETHFKGKAKPYYMVFDELPVSAIEPDGWLKSFLEDQRDGLTGHIEVAGFPFDTTMWAGKRIRNSVKEGDWAAYEQTAFYLDGMLRVALLLRDEAMLAKAWTQIEYVLNHPDETGMLGPKHVKARWPRANFFRFMRAWYNATGDRRIVDALIRHYKADQDLVDNEEFGRGSVMIETLGWLYQLTGDETFVQRAVKMKTHFDQTNKGHACSTESLLSDNLPHVHGAMFSEMVHLPAILYMCSGDEMWLNASANGYAKIDRQEMLPDGGFSSEEGTNGNGPRNVHETCAVADYAYNTGYLLMATGQSRWADRIEKACLNAGPSVVTDHFKAFQYFSGPNLLRSTRWSSHVDAPFEKDDTKTHFTRARFRYRPGHPVPCCTGSVHRLMPAYASRLWLSDRNGGLAAALYAPCKVTARVGADNQRVEITEETEFPFSDTIVFKIKSAKPVSFPLYLRIPSWTETAQIKINDVLQQVIIPASRFVRLEQSFGPSTIIELKLPMTPKMTQWPENGVAVERGPLVYTLKIDEDRRPVDFTPWEYKDAEPNPEWPQWDITPASSWNYALATDADHIAQDAEMVFKPVGSHPWQAGQAPVEMILPVRKVPGWELLRLPAEQVRHWPAALEQRPDTYLFTPHLPETVHCTEEIEQAVFVPYGSSCLRLTILPMCPRE